MKMKKIDNDTMKKLHEIQIEILDEIVRICKKYNLKYFLEGGTLLGGVRHKGFIPWDDDLDIGMLRDDYEKFIDVAPNELSDKYYLETHKYNKSFFLGFSKIKKNNTEFAESSISHLDIHKGIFVDIFPYDKIDNSRKIISKIRNMYIIYSIDAIYIKKKIMKLRDTRRPVICSLLMLLPINLVLKLQHYFMTMDKNRHTEYLCDFVGGFAIDKSTFNKQLCEEQMLVEFEGKKYTTFKNYDEYLTMSYGDYMQLPPVEERVNHCPDKIDFEHGKNIITRDLIKNKNI